MVENDLDSLLIQKSKYELQSELYWTLILDILFSFMAALTLKIDSLLMIDFIFRSNLKKSFEGSTIVYCPTKKETENVAAALQGKWKIFYHG